MSDFKPIPEFDRNSVNSPDHLNALSVAVYQLQQVASALIGKVNALNEELASLEVVEDEPAKPAARASASKTAAK